MPDSSGYKYLVKIEFQVDGPVDKPDVVGAIFGQTEGLFGPELDLNELQRGWRIGRIEISLRRSDSRVTGEVHIPANTDIAEAALIAAALETIDKVGPYQAKFRLKEIEDVRAARRKQVVERAKEIVKEWSSKAISEGEDALREVYEALKPTRLVYYGPEQLPAGPGVYNSDTVIVVEGRADVINMLRAGIENVVAIGGARGVPESIIQLGKTKKLIAFLDGDRGGDMILRDLQSKVELVNVYRAPQGREVEELTPEEIRHILREEAPPAPAQAAAVQRPQPQLPQALQQVALQLVKDLEGTLEAVLLDQSFSQSSRVPVSRLYQTIQESSGIKAVVFDGIVTQRLVDAAASKGVEFLIGSRVADGVKAPEGVVILSFGDLKPLEAQATGGQ
ncbi:MAG: DNA primase [Thaumarchaeota archaeon]|nr:DNA primase [Nitrososphaerota archaeon]